MNIVILVQLDPYWISRKDTLEPIKLSSINKVSLVRFPPVVTLDQ